MKIKFELSVRESYLLYKLEENTIGKLKQITTKHKTMITKVKNLYSNNGNKVPNQFEITQTKKNYCLHTFQSYDTIIAKIEYKNNSKKITFDNNALHYSRTTNKYLYNFMRMNRKKIDKLIKLKQIKFKDLN